MNSGYWNIHRLAHTICLLLEYKELNYEGKKYMVGDVPDHDRSQWLNEKLKPGLDFPNLPYLIDDAFEITQSDVIFCYIAYKYNLWGETEEKIHVDIFEN